MCGFAGFIDYKKIKDYDIYATAIRMGTAIAHRGPDDSGVWFDDVVPLAFIHRRLSILDLTPAGHQPMLSPCGRYILVYNGEIYNHTELRCALDTEGRGDEWRGHSDTEILLAGLIHWGVEGTLSRLNGMFAFALWDRVDQKLFLARDRMGEKPLYYGRCNDSFMFGSELKALKAHPKWNAEIDRNALSLYLRYNYVPAPWSIYRGIFKLPAAHYVVIQYNGDNIGNPICYWDLGRVAENGQHHMWEESENPVDALDKRLREAVYRRMTADVPLGAFLSGGYDSSMVVALMQTQSVKPIRTFSIGFEDVHFNEAKHAKAIASYLGTDHTELYVTPEQAMAVIPKLPMIYDEPFADSSQIPTYLVSELARSKVTVALSGDGGDELFCGYNRYVLGYQIWSILSILPLPLRSLISKIFAKAHVYGRTLETMQKLFPISLRANNLSDRLPKLANVLAHKDGESFYRILVSHSMSPNEIVLGGVESETILTRYEALPDLPGFRDLMMYLDQMTYLPDDILTKVDRASMAVSLEARVPLLDHNLIEFVWQLPIKYKYRAGIGKWLLREVLYRYVPKSLMDRPKMGFGVPIEHWLKGPLHEWAEDLLDEKKLIHQGFFDHKTVRLMLSEHMSGKQRLHYQLWDILMFQAWLENNI